MVVAFGTYIKIVFQFRLIQNFIAIAALVPQAFGNGAFGVVANANGGGDKFFKPTGDIICHGGYP